MYLYLWWLSFCPAWLLRRIRLEEEPDFVEESFFLLRFLARHIFFPTPFLPRKLSKSTTLSREFKLSISATSSDDLLSFSSAFLPYIFHTNRPLPASTDWKSYRSSLHKFRSSASSCFLTKCSLHKYIELWIDHARLRLYSVTLFFPFDNIFLLFAAAFTKQQFPVFTNSLFSISVPLPRCKISIIRLRKLIHIKSRIFPVLFHQFFMISDFFDISVFHIKDHICVTDRRKSVGDHKTCASFISSAIAFWIRTSVWVSTLLVAFV